MTKDEIQKRLREVLKTSPHRGDIRRVSLFGSHLHGKANAKSDVDLLIEFREPISIFKLVRMERELGKILGKNVDLCTPMSLSKYFRSKVVREAEPLFETAS